MEIGVSEFLAVFPLYSGAIREMFFIYYAYVHIDLHISVYFTVYWFDTRFEVS